MSAVLLIIASIVLFVEVDKYYYGESYDIFEAAAVSKITIHFK